MSKTMQINVRIQPDYSNDFKGAFPNLARSMGHLDPSLPSQNPTVYELAGQLETLLYRFDGTLLRRVLFRHRDEIGTLHKQIEENLAERKLTEADRLLYQLEDLFSDMEIELDSF